jgi:cytidylate kinase
MDRPNRIAIDGPAASGKSTLGMSIARNLAYLYLDTGVMYRAVTLAALRQGIPLSDEDRVVDLASRVDIDVRQATVQDGRQTDVLLEGEDVTWAIRSPEVDANVSEVSAYRGVRRAMGAIQRQIGQRGQVVMVGRDIGTVILPEAELKIYLDATAEERARRRHLECLARGEPADYQSILEAMRERDRIDSTRDIAPLRPAEDAVVLDTTGMGIPQVLETAMGLVGAHASNAPSGPSPEAVESMVFPWRVRWFRAIGRPAFRLLFHILCRVKIEGLENVPRSGAYIVSANHLSIIDPPFIIAFWPRPLEPAGAVEVLNRPFQGDLMRLYGGMSVHRGAADRALLDEAVRRLRSGLPLYMDPEGRRSHVPGMQSAHPGVAYLVARTGVSVVPVGITGAEQATARWRRLRRADLKMVIGTPLCLPPVNLRSAERKPALLANTETIMRAIATLLPEEYRGVYA